MLLSLLLIQFYKKHDFEAYQTRYFTLKESDLSGPVVKHFESLGYLVNCEVKDCDIVARKDDYLIAVEIKRGFNARLLFQVMDRQNFADEVYIALPKPKQLRKDAAKIRKLAQILNFGLIYVSLGAVSYVDVMHVPEVRDIPRKNIRKIKTMKEAEKRSFELNEGGSARKKIATAYREKCIAIAAAIYIEGNLTSKEIKDKYITGTDVNRALSRNHYGWFDKEADGTYSLKDSAREELESGNFARLFNLYLEKFCDKNNLPTIDNQKE